MNTTKINNLSLMLFNAVLDTGNVGKPVLFEKYGVMTTPRSAYAKEQIQKFLNSNKLSSEQLNKTFYNSWKTIEESTRFELLIDQIVHYMSTYGTDFQGPTWIPREELADGENDFELNIYAIGALSRDQLVEKCKGMFSSGIALKQETITQVIDLLTFLDYKFDSVDWVKNREAKVILIDKFNVYPSDPTEFFRYVIYKVTGETLLIKNKNMVEAIKNGNLSEVDKLFNKYGLEKLATIFNRFKPLFLAFKSGGRLSTTINKISKLSKEHHKPLVENPINQVTGRLLNKGDVHWLDNATPFALFKALNALNLRMSGQEDFIYNIRNGKVWVDLDRKNKDVNSNMLQNNFKTIMEYMRGLFAHLKGAKVRLPENVLYALPTSEKMFVGNLPYGTIVTTNKHIMAGVYWEDSWGARDLDLSGMNITGKVGWNARYNSYALMYSGDITRAPNGATEYLFGKNCPYPSIVMVNCFSGEANNHKYKIIVGEGSKEIAAKKSYMMKADNRIIDEEFTSTSRQSVVGVIFERDGQMAFSLSPGCGGNARVSGYGKFTEEMLNAYVFKAQKALTLNTVLAILGAEVIQGNDDVEVDYDLSLNKVERSSFLELFKI